MKGTGAERLMFAFSIDGVQMKSTGGNSVFDSALVAGRNGANVVEVQSQSSIFRPPKTPSIRYSSLAERNFFSTRRAGRSRNCVSRTPSLAFPGELLADVVPAEVLATLAVIEQNDDADFVKGVGAIDEVLSQYGLKAGGGVSVQCLERSGLFAHAVHEQQGKWHGCDGGQAMPRG